MNFAIWVVTQNVIVSSTELITKCFTHYFAFSIKTWPSSSWIFLKHQYEISIMFDTQCNTASIDKWTNILDLRHHQTTIVKVSHHGWPYFSEIANSCNMGNHHKFSNFRVIFMVFSPDMANDYMQYILYIYINSSKIQQLSSCLL